MKKTARARKKPHRSGKQESPGETHPDFAPVVRAFANRRGVTYGKMFASMGLKVNGKIFAMHAKGAFVAKLPQERVEEIVKQGKGTRFDPGHGRLMKEWIAIEGKPATWIALAREARDFVKGN